MEISFQRWTSLVALFFLPFLAAFLMEACTPAFSVPAKQRSTASKDVKEIPKSETKAVVRTKSIEKKGLGFFCEHGGAILIFKKDINLFVLKKSDGLLVNLMTAPPGTTLRIDCSEEIALQNPETKKFTSYYTARPLYLPPTYQIGRAIKPEPSLIQLASDVPKVVSETQFKTQLTLLLEPKDLKKGFSRIEFKQEFASLLVRDGVLFDMPSTPPQTPGYVTIDGTLYDLKSVRCFAAGLNHCSSKLLALPNSVMQELKDRPKDPLLASLDSTNPKAQEVSELIAMNVFNPLVRGAVEYAIGRVKRLAWGTSGKRGKKDPCSTDKVDRNPYTSECACYAEVKNAWQYAGFLDERIRGTPAKNAKKDIIGQEGSFHDFSGVPVHDLLNPLEFGDTPLKGQLNMTMAQLILSNRCLAPYGSTLVYQGGRYGHIELKMQPSGPCERTAKKVGYFVSDFIEVDAKTARKLTSVLIFSTDLLEFLEDKMALELRNSWSDPKRNPAINLNEIYANLKLLPPQG